MSNYYPLDFDAINQQALSRTVNFITQWLPGGDFCGTDYCPLNPTRNDKHKGSFRINTKTAQWHDFATGDKGVGLISLYSYIKGTSPSDSAKFLAETMNVKDRTMIETLKYNENTNYDLLTLAADFNYKGFDNATTSWAFRNIDGEILIVTDRFDYPDGSKKVLPRCYVFDKLNNKKGWLQKKLLPYNPLYNLENFQAQANLPVLFVEGEKACEAAKSIYGKDFWCTTWLGGANGVSKVDTSLIKNRTVYFLPDNDEAGRKAMDNLAYKLQKDNALYQLKYPANEFPEAWDIADEFPNNWNSERLKSCVYPIEIKENKKFNANSFNKGSNSEVSSTQSDIKPFDGDVNGLELVNQLIEIVHRYVIVNNNEALAIVYWILQTYNIETFTYAPRLLLISPEKRCGKTTLLELLRLLCYKPWSVGNCTPAVLYKIISKEQPTILIDEADSFFTGNSDLRNIINVGYQHSCGIARSCGKNFEDIKNYNVFSMMAIAAINSLSDTIMDRGIKINMRRKLPSETIQPLRERIVGAEFDVIKSKCRKLMLDIGKQAGDNIIPYIDGLNDRACDVWEGMISIASIIGDKERLIKAAQNISVTNQEDTDNIKNTLLKDILKVFQDNSFQDISSADLVNALNDMEDSPWSEINKGRPLTAHKLSFYLKEYKISTFQKYVYGKNRNHYHFNSFVDIFNRYIPAELAQAKQNVLRNVTLQFTDTPHPREIEKIFRQGDTPVDFSCYQ